MIKAEEFNNYFQAGDNKQSAYGCEKSVKSLFGMLSHRAKTVPLSVEEMETIIKQRRYERAVE